MNFTIEYLDALGKIVHCGTAKTPLLSSLCAGLKVMKWPEEAVRIRIFDETGHEILARAKGESPL